MTMYVTILVDLALLCSCLATHGTGVAFGNLATMVTKLELVSGKGEVRLYYSLYSKAIKDPCSKV